MGFLNTQFLNCYQWCPFQLQKEKKKKKVSYQNKSAWEKKLIAMDHHSNAGLDYKAILSSKQNTRYLIKCYVAYMVLMKLPV